MDIVFYDLMLKKLLILPPSSEKNGFIAFNAKAEMQGYGSMEIFYRDDELTEIVRQHPEGLIARYGYFCGIVTDYRFAGDGCRLYGTHINGLLHRIAVPKAEYSGTISQIAKSALGSAVWLTVRECSGASAVTYQTDKYMHGDDFIKNLCQRAKMGYRVEALNEKFTLSFFSPKENPLMFSESNLNAYDFCEDYDGKGIANTGWYEEEQEADGETVSVWKSVSTSPEKKGIYKIETVLDAKTQAEALEELKQCSADYSMSVTSKNTAFQTDYELGDIVRVRNGNRTVKRIVTAAELWCESSEFKEQPILSELEDIEENE